MKIQISQLKKYIKDIQIAYISRVGKFILQYLVEIEILVALFIGLHFLMFVPYLNLIIAPWMIYFVSVICAKYIFSLDRRIMIHIALGLFVLAFVYTLKGNHQTAEEIGNVIYGVLWFVGIISLKEVASS